MKYRSCDGIESRRLIYDSNNDDNGSPCIRVRCGDFCHNQFVEIGSPQETIYKYLKVCSDVVAERVRIDVEGSPEKRVLTKGCVGCPEYRMGDWYGNVPDAKVRIVGFNAYSFCNANCIYCNMSENMNRMDPTSIDWKPFIRMLEYSVRAGIIHKYAVWTISSGEISIHPLKDRILEMTKVSKGNIVFFTNCFIYDEKIGEILRSNPNAQINFSIDCGTPETWHKIKGHDNFHQVIGNLDRYKFMTTNNRQIYLKYIILPGINDSDEDFKQFARFIKRYDVWWVSINLDSSSSDTVEYNEGILTSILHLIDIIGMKKSDVSINMGADIGMRPTLLRAIEERSSLPINRTLRPDDFDQR